MSASKGAVLYRVRWERVTGHAQHERLVGALQQMNARRNRHERRVWAKLTLRAMRLGLIEPAGDLPGAEAAG